MIQMKSNSEICCASCFQSDSPEVDGISVTPPRHFIQNSLTQQAVMVLMVQSARIHAETGSVLNLADIPE